MIRSLKSYCGLYRLVNISSQYNYSTRGQNPFSRTWNLLSREVPEFLGINQKQMVYPEHADIVILGGGFIGSAVAYWLKVRAGEGLSVVVIEKDPTYKSVQNNLTLGTLTQHFSLPENVLLGQFGAEFIRNYKEHLDDKANMQYCPLGQLVLASEKYADKLEENVQIMREQGVRNELLTVGEINEKYPWINTHDIRLGCISTEGEGTFKAWTLLNSIINKNIELGTTYVHAEVVGFELEQQRDVLMEGIAPGSFKKINRVLYKVPNGEEYGLQFAGCVLAAGSKSGEIAKLAKVGTGDGLLSIPLPIEEREQKVYIIEENTNNKYSLNTPMICDTSGLWIQKNGLQKNLICGHVPIDILDVNASDSDEFYSKLIKPALVNRIPGYDNKDNVIKKVISETYDYNTYDETGFVGPHPYHNNLYLATGFGKLGCAHAVGIGRGIAELIIDSDFTTIDLTRFTFDRLLTDRPMIEFNIY